MSATFDDSNRQVIPRWLDYSTSCSLILLRNIRKHEDLSLVMPSDSRTSQDWQSCPSIGTAVDLIAEAMILKDFESDQALEAAEFVLKNAPPSLPLIHQLAQHFIDKSTLRPYFLDIGLENESTIGEHLAYIRKQTRAHILNPIVWSELSLEYAKLGHVDKSRRAMQIALGLGKHNRLILRSAARCFLHVNEADRAIAILRDSERCSSDPWIASAEIAISEAMGFSSKCVSKARHMINDDNITHYSRSELVASISTMEMKNGSVKRAKHLLHETLLDPTENALAQAAWLAGKLQTQIATDEKTTPASFEAESRHFFLEKKYEASLAEGLKWASFQPFSSRPFIHATYIAATFLGDYERVIRIVENASQLHMRDPLFANNYACSLARYGRVADAERTLRSIDTSTVSETESFSLLATQGLVRYREGKIDEAREYYAQAMRGFISINDTKHEAVAAYYLATEEKRLGTEYATALIKAAKKKIKVAGAFAYEDLVEKL